MRRALALAMVVGLLAAPALAGDRLSIYADPAFTECTLSDNAPGSVSAYVAYTSTDVVGLRFRIAATSGFTGVWLADASPYVHIGSSQTDLSLGLGACLTGKFLILTMTYQLFGTSTCSELGVAPAMGFTMPFSNDCFFQELPIHGDPLHINCSGSFSCNPVPVEPSTWGKVKSLYRD